MDGVARVALRACLLAAILCIAQAVDQQWLFQSEAKWNKEWKSGAWTYMDTVAVERARVAVISGVLIPMFGNANASVLDIGCGEGPIADFLTPHEKSKYVGVDISKEAIGAAKRARGPPLKFVHAAAHEFVPNHKFDVVVFSEVLYYVEYEKVLKQYEGYLNPGGVIIISIFHQSDALMYENISNFARKEFVKVDEIDIGGFTKKSKDGKSERTACHIETYKMKAKS
ncbi:S-adenosyl-L-methionine-dependent methyltransferase [Ochromonadaceae sp. CCMP2298]|nr:S-adenosyl-L-methionine-dependent methyltransferase [Ochromonadaceae sp. CCMP2298]